MEHDSVGKLIVLGRPKPPKSPGVGLVFHRVKRVGFGKSITKLGVKLSVEEAEKLLAELPAIIEKAKKGEPGE